MAPVLHRAAITSEKFGSGWAALSQSQSSIARQKIDIVRLTAGAAQRVLDDGAELQRLSQPTVYVSEQK